MTCLFILHAACSSFDLKYAEKHSKEVGKVYMRGAVHQACGGRRCEVMNLSNRPSVLLNTNHGVRRVHKVQRSMSHSSLQSLTLSCACVHDAIPPSSSPDDLTYDAVLCGTRTLDVWPSSRHVDQHVKHLRGWTLLAFSSLNDRAELSSPPRVCVCARVHLSYSISLSHANCILFL